MSTKWVSSELSLGSCQWNYSRYTLVLVTHARSDLFLRNDPEFEENTQRSCILITSHPLISNSFRQLHKHIGPAIYYLFISALWQQGNISGTHQDAPVNWNSLLYSLSPPLFFFSAKGKSYHQKLSMPFVLCFGLKQSGLKYPSFLTYSLFSI